MKKFSILLITAVLSISAVTVNAASIPRETATSVRLPSANVSLLAARPSCRHAASATEEAIVITENLISDILDADLIVDVQNGKDFDIAIDEAHTLIYKSADPTYDPAVDRIGDSVIGIFPLLTAQNLQWRESYCLKHREREISSTNSKTGDIYLPFSNAVLQIFLTLLFNFLF